MRKLIFYLFAVLIFFIPLVLWPYTSEVFEFNKIVLVYILTTLITGAWIIRSAIERKFIFSRTILDMPLLVFLVSQIISTIFSIDPYTSFFGYYSRFNGGLLSIICYAVLYWGFVSNFDKHETIKLIKVWFASAALVSIYGVLEHFGIDKNVWVQDVASRVFSTLGQPNWLAAWIVALIPLTWVFALKSKIRSVNFWLYFGLSILFFWTLIFTKSRSGLLAFGVVAIIFWGLYLWKNLKSISIISKQFLVISFSLLVICIISGTQFTPSINSIINKSTNVALRAKQIDQQPQGTVLETGGTESGTIRKIVWQGAIQVWQHYPIFGSGVETFGYSYYLFRPTAHNLTSEWDFIYNKAHNEFLNFAATTGTFGILSYLVLIGFSIYIFLKNESEDKSLNFALLAGYVGLSVSNFFGFSVVPTQLQFFLFPAIAAAIAVPSTEYQVPSKKMVTSQKVFIFFVLCTTSCVLWLTVNYWYADIVYSKGKSYNSVPRPDLATPLLLKSIKLEPSQAIYYGELANSYTNIALAYDQAKDSSKSSEFSNLAISVIENGIFISPANLNLRRSQFSIYVRLSSLDEKYLVTAREALNQTIKLAPSDPKLYFNLGIVDANLGRYDLANIDFKKTIELKANYTDARIQYAALLVHLKRNLEAKDQLNYILKNIEPANSTAKQALENLK